MKLYSAHGVNEFVVCCGYRGYVIKEYFANYFLHMSDVTFDMANNAMQVHERHAEPWKVTLVDTGDETMTGGPSEACSRLCPQRRGLLLYLRGWSCRHRHYSRDRVSSAARQVGHCHGGTTPPGRYGALQLSGDRVRGFVEKTTE